MGYKLITGKEVLQRAMDGVDYSNIKHVNLEMGYFDNKTLDNCVNKDFLFIEEVNEKGDELSIEDIFKAILKKETNLVLGVDFDGGEVWLLSYIHVEDLEQESIKFFRIEG